MLFCSANLIYFVIYHNQILVQLAHLLLNVLHFYIQRDCNHTTCTHFFRNLYFFNPLNATGAHIHQFRMLNANLGIERIKHSYTTDCSTSDYRCFNFVYNNVYNPPRYLSGSTRNLSYALLYTRRGVTSWERRIGGCR